MPAGLKKRQAILELYGHICAQCALPDGTRKKDNAHILHIHHIDKNSKNNSYWNLIPLCPRCHKQVHKTGLLPTDWDTLSAVVNRANILEAIKRDLFLNEAEIMLNAGKDLLQIGNALNVTRSWLVKWLNDDRGYSFYTQWGNTLDKQSKHR